MLQLLLDHSVSSDCQSAYSEEAQPATSSLHLAAAHYNLSAAEILLENGADPSIKDGDGSSSLHKAVFRRFSRLVEMLILEHGANQ